MESRMEDMMRDKDICELQRQDSIIELNIEVEFFRGKFVSVEFSKEQLEVSIKIINDLFEEVCKREEDLKFEVFQLKQLEEELKNKILESLTNILVFED